MFEMYERDFYKNSFNLKTNDLALQVETKNILHLKCCLIS